MREEIRRERRLRKLKRSVPVREAQMVLRREKEMNTNPEFEEGPFFLIEATVYPHMGKRAIMWATDKSTARNVFAFKLNLPTAYCIVSCLGGLEDVKNTLKLSGTQIADLHREGYLRL